MNPHNCNFDSKCLEMTKKKIESLTLQNPLTLVLGLQCRVNKFDAQGIDFVVPIY